MKERIIDEANKYIVKIENDYIVDLARTIKRASTRAEKCGCPQCKKYYVGLAEQFGNEIERMVGPTILSPKLINEHYDDPIDNSYDDFEEDMSK